MIFYGNSLRAEGLCQAHIKMLSRQDKDFI